MKSNLIQVFWPNGKTSLCKIGDDWIEEAKKIGMEIPTGCLTGSCGACEIETNGKVIRACIQPIEQSKTNSITVDFAYDPYW